MQNGQNSGMWVVLDSLAVKTFTCDKQGIMTYFNNKWLAYRGTTLTQELNGGWCEGIHPNDLPNFVEVLTYSIENKTAFNVEYRLLRFDGVYRHMLSTVEPIFVNDEFIGFNGVTLDVTIHKDIIDEHARTLYLLNETNAMTKVGGWDYDVVNKKNTWTKEVYHIHEVDDSYVPNLHTALDFYHPEDKATIKNAFANLYYHAEPFDLELRIITAKGNIRWVHVQGKAIKEKENTVQLLGAFQDITEEKEKELARIESERKLRFVLNGLPVAVYLTDADGYITDHNDCAVELWGRTPKLAVDRWCGSTKLYNILGEIVPPGECPMAKAIKLNRSIFGEEAMLEREDGTKINFIAFATPYYNENNQLLGAMNVMVDITDRKLIEEKLTTLSYVARKTSNAVIITDASRKITWVNPGFTKMTGYTSDEAIGKNPGELLQFEKTNQETIGYMREAFAKVRPIRGELLNKGKRGNEFWVDMDIQPLTDMQGKITGFIAVQSDITEIKFMHDALRKSENKLRAILDSTSEMNVLLDKSCRILSYNRVAAHNVKMLFGRNIGLGELLWDYPLDKMRNELEYNISRAMLGISAKIETELKFEGISFWIEIAFFPVYDNQGELMGVALNGKDIENRKRAELKIEMQNKKLMEIAFAQSHTLRRPIANMLGLWDLLTTEFNSISFDELRVREILDLMGKSIQETDEVIRKIVKATKQIDD
jgi:PAS domain S-box-containing protein